MRLEALGEAGEIPDVEEHHVTSISAAATAGPSRQDVIGDPAVEVGAERSLEMSLRALVVGDVARDRGDADRHAAAVLIGEVVTATSTRLSFFRRARIRSGRRPPAQGALERPALGLDRPAARARRPSDPRSRARVAEQPLGPRVPGRHRCPSRGEPDDCVVGALDDRAQPLKLVLGLLLRGPVPDHVAEAAKRAGVVADARDHDGGPEPQAVAPHTPAGLLESPRRARDLQVALGRPSAPPRARRGGRRDSRACPRRSSP